MVDLGATHGRTGTARATTPPRRSDRPERLTLLVLAALAILACVLFLTLGARGNWSFVLPFRGAKLAAMLLVAHAIATSTVVFQTIAGNRILTPSIMGFDALYRLIQTLLVFLTGAATTAAIAPAALFAGELLVMVLFACGLYGTLIGAGTRDIHRLLLVGVVLGILFHSTAGLMQRLIDPNDFVVLQDRLFASFNTIETGLLGIAAVLIGGASLALWRMTATLDVLSLGRDRAISLGIAHRRAVMLVLATVAVLVSVSTALVGPVTFFGLLVASLAVSIVGARSHRLTMTAASLIAIICLVGGQTLLEHVLHFDTALGIVVEFAGGLVFLALILKKGIA